jgi:hypothetical protein
MLDLKKYNWFSPNSSDNLAISVMLRNILPFLEMEGYNSLTLVEGDNYFINYGLLDNCKFFRGREDLEKFAGDSGNLFRVNLVVLDLIFCQDLEEVNGYLTALGHLDVKFIILVGKPVPKRDSNSTFYSVESIFEQLAVLVPLTKPSKVRINLYNIWEDWKSDLDDLKMVWIRDKKISGFLDESGLDGGDGVD